ncbi:MAG: hypothetical protein AB7E47_02780 [Desulfovibrionaceae bacterium]
MRRNLLGLPKLPAGVRVRVKIIWPWSSEGAGLWAWWDGVATITLFLRLWLWLLGVCAVVRGYVLHGAMPWEAWAAFAFLAMATWLALKHDSGHALGVPASGCLGGHKWCVMAEETQVGWPDGSWIGKAMLLPYQIVRGQGRYCPACTSKITLCQRAHGLDSTRR